MIRKQFVFLALPMLLATWLVWRGFAEHAPPAPSSQKPAPAATGAGTAASPDERARVAWQSMGALLAKSRRTNIVLSAPVRRAGESEPFFEERKRAVGAYEHFLKDGHATPEQDVALRGLFVDAQESWRLALKTVGRKQPEAPGAEMADPVLSSMFGTINDEFLRGARASLPEMQGAMFQSEVPTVLGYVRTQAFETR